MSSEPKNSGGPPHRDPSPSGPTRGPEDFDPDAALAEVRAREAMEVLRRREQAGPLMLESRRPERAAHLGASPEARSLPPPRWTNAHAQTESFAEEVLPYPDPADDVLPAAFEADDEEGSGEEEAESDVDTSPPEGHALTPRVAVDPSDPRFETPEDPRIPGNQATFRIGEVAQIVGVKAHVLRFWETEFDWVEPEKTDTNQRRYRRADVARLLQIRRLRHDAHLTVAQTRAFIEEALRTGQPPRSTLSQQQTPEAERSDDGASPAELRRCLSDMRRAVVELLEAVEDADGG